MRLIAIGTVVILAMIGCTTSAGGEEELVGRVWTLESIEGFTSFPSDVATPTIRFAPDGLLSGNTGCNGGGAAYRIEGDNLLVIEPMTMTKRACANPEGNRLERAYVAAVQNAHSFRVTSTTLELLNESGEVLARFR